MYEVLLQRELFAEFTNSDVNKFTSCKIEKNSNTRGDVEKYCSMKNVKLTNVWGVSSKMENNVAINAGGENVRQE